MQRMVRELLLLVLLVLVLLLLKDLLRLQSPLLQMPRQVLLLVETQRRCPLYARG